MHAVTKRGVVKTESQYRLGSDSNVVLVMKYWLPAILFLGIGTVIRGAHHALALAAIPTLWAVFNLTAAELRASDAIVEYRRFLKWKRVRYDEIRGCKASWIPGTAYLKLGRFLPPWGRLYFVELRPAFESGSTWPRGQGKLTAFIEARRRGKPAEPSSDKGRVTDDGKKAAAFCVVMGTVGIFCSLLFHSLLPMSLLDRNWEGFPTWIVTLVNAEKHAFGWPWGLATCGLLVAWIVGLHFRRRAWILAFAVGAILGSLVIRTFV